MSGMIMLPATLLLFSFRCVALLYYSFFIQHELPRPLGRGYIE